MATSTDYIEYVADSLARTGLTYDFSFKKMFGEYCVYANAKPIMFVCDNTVFVKPQTFLSELLHNSAKAQPYEGAKEYFVLDIDDTETLRKVTEILEQNTPLPRPRKRKQQ